MRDNMSRGLITLAIFLLVGCSSGTAEDDLYGAGYVIVNEQTWGDSHTTPYPFTVPEGEISCGSNPIFGREVYFEPKGYTDESYIGTPLNKSAVDALSQADMSANVPYSVKVDVDLNEAVQAGLEVCNEQKDYLHNP